MSKIRWKAVRYIREEYECWGDTRKEAREYLAEMSDPFAVTVVKETIVKAKEGEGS